MNLRKEDLINARERFSVPQKKLTHKVDEPVSKIVGKTVLQTDPRLIKLIVKHKTPKSDTDFKPDNHLKNPEFIKELKQVFSI